jgi:hypothetical protein
VTAEIISAVIDAFKIRREIEHRPSEEKVAAVKAEMERLCTDGPPCDATEQEVENAIDRWLDPEPVDRTLVTAALWEMERHWWTALSEFRDCRCGLRYEGDPALRSKAMAAHKEDVLAQMLGLSIRPDPE